MNRDEGIVLTKMLERHNSWSMLCLRDALEAENKISRNKMVACAQYHIEKALSCLRLLTD